MSGPVLFAVGKSRSVERVRLEIVLLLRTALTIAELLSTYSNIEQRRANGVSCVARLRFESVHAVVSPAAEHKRRTSSWCSSSCVSSNRWKVSTKMICVAINQT